MPSAVALGVIKVVGVIAAKKTLAVGLAVAFKAFATGFVTGLALDVLSRAAAKKPSRPGGVSDSEGVAGSTRGLVGSVIPKRWVVGRARVSGGLVWFGEDGRYQYQVLVLSAGACDGIERVWAHGEEVEMVRNGNVLTPAPGSKYNGTREETYEQEYFEWVRVPEGGPDGPSPDLPSRPTPTPPDLDRFLGPQIPAPIDFERDRSPGGPGFEGDSGQPGRESACGGCRGSMGCQAGPDQSFAHNGMDDWGGSVSHNTGRGLNMFGPWWDSDIPLRDLLRWNPAVKGTAASAGAMASAGGGGVGGQQGENDEEAREQAAARPTRSGYTRVRRTRTRTRTVNVPLIKVTEYFKADGTEGAEIRSIAARLIAKHGAEGRLPWTDDYIGNGVSYVLVELYQPEYDTTSVDAVNEDRFWPGPPAMNFMMRGIKVSYPVADATAPSGRRLTEPAWTDNAAVLRYWYLTERRGLDPDAIDLTYFDAARRLCDTDLQLTEASNYHSDYPESVKRYTINGSVTSGDSAAALDNQFDFAWQGFVVEHGGRFLFRPGADQPVRFLITEDDVVSDPEVMPFGSRSELANELSVSIEQSISEDFLPENFVVVDATAQASDGERLPQELTGLKFVNDPVQAINFLHQRLRQQRGLVSVNLHVKSPPDWRYLELVAGDKIALELPEHGIGADGALRNFRVNGVQINDDYTANLSLLEWPDNLYDDQFDFPPRTEKFNYAPAPIDAPVGQGVIDWNINREGAVVWTAFLSWASAPGETVISVDSPFATETTKRTHRNSESFDLLEAGRYTFNLRHVSNGISSAVSQVVLDATYTDIPLPKPVIIDVVQQSNIIVIRVENVPNRDIAGLDVRYEAGGIDTDIADIPVVTEATWDSAAQMNVSPVVPPSADDPIFAYAVLPASGTYRVYVRLRNRVGNLSPISNVVDARFQVPATATGSVASHPLWAGVLNGMLVWRHDGENRLFPDPRTLVTTIDYGQWEGDGAFPFGGLTAGESYTTQILNFPDTKRREVTVLVETSTPEGKTPSAPIGLDIVMRRSTSENLPSPTESVVREGVATTLDNIRSVQVVVRLNRAVNHVIAALTVAWREVQ